MPDAPAAPGADAPPSADGSAGVPPADPSAAAQPASAPARRARGRSGRSGPRPEGAAHRHRQATTNRWMRTIHAYTSMVSLLLVLFFGLTGLTLNHPAWTLGDEATSTTATGTLPEGFATDGTVDFLAVTEYVRTTEGVRGDVTDYGVTGGQGGVGFGGPGYAATLVFDVETGDYSLTEEEQGWVGVLNDVHKGHDTGSSWRWAIDASAGFLVVVALSGLGIQVFQHKRRRWALAAAGAGAVAAVVLILVTLA